MVNLVIHYLVFVVVVDIIATLVSSGIVGVIVTIDTSVAVVSSSISPPISVTGGTFKSLVIPWLVLSLLLVKSALYKSYSMMTNG